MIKHLSLLAILLLCASSVLAIDNIPVYVTPLDGGGNRMASQYIAYNLKLTNNVSCGGASLATVTQTILTNKYGVGVVEIPLNYLNTSAAYMCEYRDSVLKNTYNITSSMFDRIVANEISINGSRACTQGNGLCPNQSTFGSWINNLNNSINLVNASIIAVNTSTNIKALFTNDFHNIGGADSDYCFSGQCNGSLTVMGNLTVIGSTINATITNLWTNGSFAPEIDDTFSIGYPTMRWADFYSVKTNGNGTIAGGAHTASYLALWNTTATVNQSIIQQSGNMIGIGGAATGYTLNVYGEIYSSTNVAAGNSFYFPGKDLLMWNTAALSDAGNAYTFADSTGLNYRQIKASSLSISQNSSSNAYFFANKTGVGIWTITPNYVLDVKGNVSLNNTLFVNNSGLIGIGISAPTYGLEVRSDSYARFYALSNGAYGSLTLGTMDIYVDGNMNIRDPSDISRLYINSTGGIGIATMKPTATLQVNGTLNVTGNSYLDSNLIVGGNVSFKRAYGMFSSTEDQALTATNTAYAVTFNITEMQYLVSKSVDNGNFTFNQTGNYLIELSAIAKSSTAGKRYYIWVEKNGVNVPRSTTIYDFKSTNAIAVIAVPFILSMNTSDRMRIMWAGDDTGISMPFVTNTTFAPSTPSIIMSISKISELT